MFRAISFLRICVRDLTCRIDNPMAEIFLTIFKVVVFDESNIAYNVKRLWERGILDAIAWQTHWYCRLHYCNASRICATRNPAVIDVRVIPAEFDIPAIRRVILSSRHISLLSRSCTILALFLGVRSMVSDSNVKSSTK